MPAEGVCDDVWWSAKCSKNPYFLKLGSRRTAFFTAKGGQKWDESMRAKQSSRCHFVQSTSALGVRT